MRSVGRRVLRQRIRAVSGGLLLALGCAALLLSSSAKSAPVASRQLTTESLHVRVRVHSALPWEETTVTANATTDATDAETCGVTAEWEEQGGIVLYVFLLVYIFVALAIVCDDYFVTALERITEKLALSQDVAGATFMAAGSSAPELFVSLADNVFNKPEGSMGIGTIVGSAIFNILIIISLSALLAGQVLMLDWRPMLRDSLWYCWAIIVLTFSIWDGSVNVLESVVLFASYIGYCIFMSQNERVTNACCKRKEDDELNEIQAKQEAIAQAQANRAAQLVESQLKQSSSLSLSLAPSDSERRAWTIDVERVEHGVSEGLRRQSSAGSSSRGAHTAGTGHHHPHRIGSQSKLNPMFRSKYRMFQNNHTMSQEQSSRRSSSAASSQLASFSESDSTTTSSKHTVTGSLRPLDASTISQAAIAASVKSAHSIQDDPEEEQQEELGPYFEEVYTMPDGFFSKAWFFFTRPIVIPMRLTIPDCRYPVFSGTLGFSATFLVSIAWIAVLSHYTVVYATRFGCIAGIPSPLMGLTILAAGTSIPDALSSILVARDGHGDMAVSNALGSNVFDILLGLGFPFFLSNLVYGEPVVISTDDLEISIFILFGVLVTVVTLLILSKWRLRRSVGAVMVMLYVVYVVFSYLHGLGLL